MMAESSEKVYCVPCCDECEDKCLCGDTTLEPHARVAHVRNADKHWHDLQRTRREKHHVCENVTLRAGFVSCVHPPSLTRESPSLCKRKHLESVFFSIMKLIAYLRMKNLLMDGRTSSNPFWGRHARNTLRAQVNC